MKDFLVRFAQKDESALYGHSFSTVREGLIVALLSIGERQCPKNLLSGHMLTLPARHPHRRIIWRVHFRLVWPETCHHHRVHGLHRRGYHPINQSVTLLLFLSSIHPEADTDSSRRSAFNAWYQIAIGRLVSGLGVGALSAAVPTVCTLPLLPLSYDSF